MDRETRERNTKATKGRLFVLLGAPLGMLTLALLVACALPPTTPDLPTPSHSPDAIRATPSIPPASSTQHVVRATAPSAGVTASPDPTASPSPSPTPIVELKLSVATYPFARLPVPESDTLDFADSVEGDPLARHAVERARHFSESLCYVAGHNGYCAWFGDDRFAAWVDSTDPEAMYVVVARNEEQVDQVAMGTVSSLWGVWAYDGHWVVETALVGTVQSGNIFTSTTTGQVVMDGVSLNEDLGYDETFSFQTLGGKPFYFFERQGVVDVSYDGVDIPLGFDEVPHLFCCSAAAFNPQAHPNLVSFYRRKGDTWYYGEIAAVPVTSAETPTPRAKVPNRTPDAVLGTPEVLAEEAIDCMPAGAFSHCVDDVLGIEFEVPASWGAIETRLRRGLDAGFAYDYYFGGKTHAETEPLVAGGRSVDFAEGRGAMPTDFGGYEDAGWQRTSACAGSGEWFSNAYPVCRQINDHVAWMIRFPNAEALCSGDLTGWTATPVFRIEISLPDNPTINGFVFEAPFFSEQFATLVESDLYRRIGISVNWEPRRCDEASKEAFDAELARLTDSLMERTADAETVEKVDELIHLAESIAVRER
ncbi:MAG: hypothetical protein PHY79_14125 [Anaerolineae bacterium]|nr:hypothetical protein [Anaerolineae bacterium]